MLSLGFDRQVAQQQGRQPLGALVLQLLSLAPLGLLPAFFIPMGQPAWCMFSLKMLGILLLAVLTADAIHSLSRRVVLGSIAGGLLAAAALALGTLA